MPQEKQNLIVQKGDKDKNLILHSMLLRGDTFFIRELIASRKNINVQNEKGMGPLHVAVGLGDIYSVKLLLDNKADINIKDNQGYTPLHYAAWKGSVSITALLIEGGADINAISNKGHSMFDVVEKLKENKKEIIDLLCEGKNRQPFFNQKLKEEKCFEKGVSFP